MMEDNSEFILYKQPNEAGFTMCHGRFLLLITGAEFVEGIVLSSFAKEKQVAMRVESSQSFAAAMESLAGWSILLNDDLEEAESSIDYKELVDKGISAIHAGVMKKVVLARKQSFGLPAIDLGAVLDRLAAANPGAFVYLLNSNEFGTWLGATPELLLSAGPDRLETMALAGTQKPGKGLDSQKSIDHFSGKELEEHRIVAEEIIQILNEEGFADVQVAGPDVHRAGSVTHLMSRIFVKDPGPIDHFRLASRLHPTSAVSGFPRDQAIDFIQKNEGFKRSLYSGFIGVVGQGRATYYVNLRCGQLNSTKITLYAGAGIVEGSVPADELAETETKMAVLKTAIGLV